MARNERAPWEVAQVGKGIVNLRRFPYPYKAGLAICSDIDGTTTLDRFLGIQEFLKHDS